MGHKDDILLILPFADHLITVDKSSNLKVCAFSNYSIVSVGSGSIFKNPKYTNLVLQFMLCCHYINLIITFGEIYYKLPNLT